MKDDDSRIGRWWLVVLAALAIVVRLPLLNGSFWLDEAAQALESTRPLSQQFVLAYDFQPPLFHLLVHLLSYLSRAEWWLRMASFLPGIASVVLTSWFSSRLVGKKTALAAGTLLAVSPWMVFYSQELRPYMLAVFFGVLAFGSWVSWLRESEVQMRTRWLITFIFSIVAGMLTSYVFLFFLPAFVLATAILDHRRLLTVIKALALSCVWFLLWWPGFLEQWRVGQELRTALPGWESVVSFLPVKALPLTLAKFFVGLRALDINILDGMSFGLPIVGLLAGSVYLIWQWFKKGESKALRSFGMLLCFFAVPLLLTWAFSIVSPVLQPKRVLYVVPFLFLLVGMIAQYGKRWGEGLFLFVLTLQVVGLAQYWTQPALQREDWRGVIDAIEAQFSPSNTAVVFAFDAPFAPWRWYSREQFTLVTTKTAPLATAEEARVYLEPAESFDHVLVFDYLRDLTDPQSFLTTSLQEGGYQEEGALGGGQLGFVRLYVKQALYANNSL